MIIVEKNRESFAVFFNFAKVQFFLKYFKPPKSPSGGLFVLNYDLCDWNEYYEFFVWIRIFRIKRLAGFFLIHSLRSVHALFIF